jgi:DNA-binding MarR family transcriptional regulator
MTTTPTEPTDYILEDQVGFVMRRATQRHLALFSQMIPDLTSTQFAALSKLCELGQVSQNALGRATAMDAATIKGVVDRLRNKGYLTSARDPNDQRRILLQPSDQGREAFETLVASAHQVTAETLAPLSADEQETFLRLLTKLT